MTVLVDRVSLRPMEILAHNIRSLFNIGAFFRNADAFGVGHVYLTGYTAAPPRPEIEKTALGADKTVKWSKHGDVQALIDELKAAGKTIVAVECDPSFVSIHEAKVPNDAVLMFGNEPDGLPQELIDAADMGVIIPMQGEKTSLNVAVASAVALYAVQNK